MLDHLISTHIASKFFWSIASRGKSGDVLKNPWFGWFDVHTC
jgi:hypothetical protein